MFLFEPSQISLSLEIVSEEQDPSFREGPFQMSIADLGADKAVGFARRFFLRFHQTAIGDEILDRP